MYKKLVELLEPPPAPATKPCAEVDGQTPPANEYCIVAENIQESFKARLVVPGFDGYEHKTTAVSSGVGFRK
ncbi:MAG: hypothetical protein ISN28_04395, partial [Ectothiorhodospiraceae bacterium AqS1]|nr:hypothetical protein [Ectothiorhodospiraceae bacterium AqS1]